ncbi:MAG: hypothetical protein JWL77_517 [Chthonomonadaceae bacterium]|nr:hypothetical protein [Chthonomonadaceae bacterium]
MPLDIHVHRVRLSFVWVRTLPDLLLLNPVPPVERKHAFLGSLSQYADKFDGLIRHREKKLLPGDLDLPWVDYDRDHFWSSYFRRTAGKVNGSSACKNLVPCHWKLGFKVQAVWKNMPRTVSVSGFLYPFGVALAVNVILSDVDLSLLETFQLAHKIRRSPLYNMAQTDYTLDALGAGGIRTLCGEMLGHNHVKAQIPGVLFDSEPYSVVTFVCASGKDVQNIPPARGELPHTLHALNNWKSDPSNHALPLPSLTQAKKNRPLMTDTDSESSVVYSAKRGECLWYPGLFEKRCAKNSLLDYYHKNLVMAAIQTESLCGLAEAVATQLNDGNALKISANGSFYAEEAAGILGLMYGGVSTSTYASISVARHIDNNGRKDHVQTIRAEYLNDRKPLHLRDA